MVPKKVCIFIWRARQSILPTRIVLEKMGLDLDSTLCPRCGEEPESTDHALVQCQEAAKVWKLVLRWWCHKEETIRSLQELMNLNFSDSSEVVQPKLWQETVWCFLYLIGSHRNNVVFKADKSKLEDKFFDFQRKSFEWIERRLGGRKAEWNVWLTEPSRVA